MAAPIIALRQRRGCSLLASCFDDALTRLDIVVTNEDELLIVDQFAIPAASPEIMQAMLLRVKDAAQAFSLTMRNLVVVMPASIENSNVDVITRAGRAIGLKVTVITAAHAAALALAFDSVDQQRERNVLLMEIEGGCYDATLMTITGGYVEERAHAVERSMGEVRNKLLIDSDFEGFPITEVVLVGGHLNRVGSLVSDFPDMRVRCLTNEDVVRGAAVQAAILSKIEAFDGMLLHRVTHSPIGVGDSAKDGMVLFPRGTRIPAWRTVVFEMPRNGSLLVKEFGRNSTTELARVMLPADFGEPTARMRVTVEFFLVENGMLRWHITDVRGILLPRHGG